MTSLPPQEGTAMEKRKERITENNIDYILAGDCYIPGLKLLEENRPIGRYGRLHREYPKQEHPVQYISLIQTGKLWTYLADLNEQTEERLDLIMEQMKAAEGVAEKLKTQNLKSTRILRGYIFRCLHHVNQYRA